MRIDLFHNKIIKDTASESFVASVTNGLAPKIEELFDDAVGILMYEDYIADGFIDGGVCYYPLTVERRSGDSTVWISWPYDKEKFSSPSPYSYIGEEPLEISLSPSVPECFEEAISARARNYDKDAMRITVRAASDDPLFLSGKYSQTFVDILSSQITREVSRVLALEGLGASSIELELVYAPGTYMEHTSENVTYRRLLMVDGASRPRDFWVKWTRIGGGVAYTLADDVSADAILFELGEDVAHKIREKEYRFLCSSNPNTYQAALGKKAVTEWRDLIKRAVRRGEITKVESELVLAERSGEIHDKLAEVLDRFGYTEPKTEEKSDEGFDSLMDMVRRALENSEGIASSGDEDKEPALAMAGDGLSFPSELAPDDGMISLDLGLGAEEADEAADEGIAPDDLEIDDAESSEDIDAAEDEPSVFDDEEAADEADEDIEAEEPDVEEPDAEDETVANEDSYEDAESITMDELFARLEKELSTDEADEPAVEEENDEPIIEDEAVVEEADEEIEEEDVEAEAVEAEDEAEYAEDIPTAGEAIVEEINEDAIEAEAIDAEADEEAAEAEAIDAEPDEEAMPAEELVITDEIMHEVNDDAEECADDEEQIIPADEISLAPTDGFEPYPTEVADEPTNEAEEVKPVKEATAYRAATDDEFSAAYTDRAELERRREEELRREIEAKIRLEYEAMARAKAEAEIERLLAESRALKEENERLARAARSAEEMHAREVSDHLETSERARATEEQLRAELEAKERAEARERDRLAEAARIAVEEQRRKELDARNEAIRLERERLEAERLEAERLEAERLAEERRREEEEAKRLEAERLAEEARRAEEARFISKRAKIIFRRPTDQLIISRIREIVEETIIANGKQNVRIHMKAYQEDRDVINLDILRMPASEGELLVSIVKAIGNARIGVTKIILE